jgi:hypothetical protein
MSTRQLIIEDEGNQAAVRALPEARYQVDTGRSVRQADLYLVDERSFPKHHAALRERVEARQPPSVRSSSSAAATAIAVSRFPTRRNTRGPSSSTTS